MFSKILTTFLAINAIVVQSVEISGSPKGQRRAAGRKLEDTNEGKGKGKGQPGKGNSFCGKAGKGKGNPPSLDAFCVEDDGLSCFGCGPSITSFTFMSETSIDAGTTFNGSVIGGISAITYDTDLGLYYLLSDDTETGKQRYYVAEIDEDTGSVEITDVRYFRRPQGSFAMGDLDPQAFSYRSPGTIIMASGGTPPSVMEFDLAGTLLRYLLVPSYYSPNSDGTFGIRSDSGFQGVSVSPAGLDIWAANGGALAQDGAVASLTEKSPVRIIKFDYETGVPAEEYVYYTDTVAAASTEVDGETMSGLTEIISLDDCGQVFLALERSYSAGVGYTCKLYEFSTCAATDQGGMETIIGVSTGTFSEAFPESETVQKTLVADLAADFGVTPDNCEGMQITTGDSGSKYLVMASDDNFSSDQTNQFLFFNIDGSFA